MTIDSDVRLDTLGLRLDRRARQLMSAHALVFGWLGPMQELLDHLAGLPGPAAGRFDRIDAVGSGAEFHDRVSSARRRSDENGPDAAGHPLPSDVGAQVRRVIGRDASAMRVHDDPRADAVARAHRAEAVTVGRDVFFRQGRFRPREPDGFRLVAHEATHVAELLAPGAAWRRLTTAGRADEEHLATANEQRAAAEWRTPLAPVAPVRPQPAIPTPPAGFVPTTRRLGSTNPPAPTPVPAAASTPAALQPMRAAEDRSEAAASGLDVEALRRSLFADLKRQLRTEFERGA